VIKFNANVLTAKPTVKRPQEVLFTVGTVEHTIPETFSAAETLMFMDSLRKYGLDAATTWALEYALGTDSWTTLLSIGSDPDHDDDFRALVGAVVTKISGGAVRTTLPKPSETPSSDSNEETPTTPES